MRILLISFLSIFSIVIYAQINPMEIDLYVDIHTSPKSSNPEPLGEYKDQLIFQADRYDGKKEIWISDGSSEGTSKIFIPSENDLSNNANAITASNENNFFINLKSFSSGLGTELYRYNESINAAELILSAAENCKALYPQNNGVLIVLKGSCGFWDHCDRIFYYDETTGETEEVFDSIDGDLAFSIENILSKQDGAFIHSITPDEDVILFSNVNNDQQNIFYTASNRTITLHGIIDEHLLFSGKDNDYEGLLSTIDGSAINLLLPGAFSELDEFQWQLTEDKLYLLGDRSSDPENDRIYACDGNTAELFLDTGDFYWGSVGTVYFFDGVLFFEKGNDFFAYDGTMPPEPLNYSGGFRDIYDIGGSLFIQSASELYRYVAGAPAQVVVDFISRDKLHPFEDKIFITRDKDIYQINTTDGSLEFIATTNVEVEDNFPYLAGGKVYFKNSDTEHAVELWVTDGTAGSFEIVSDINTGTGSLRLNSIKSLGNKLFINTGDWNVSENEYSRLLVFNDDTKEQYEIYDQECQIESTGEYLIVTQEVKNTDSLDIFSTQGIPNDFTHLGKFPRTGFVNTNPSSELFRYGNKVLINYDGGLMITDGTKAGTVNLANISINDDFIIYKDIFYFQAAAYSFPNQENQFWRTDGTVAGTYRLLDFEVDNIYIYKDYLLVHRGDHIYFNDGSSDDFDSQWLTDVDHYFSDKNNFYVVRNGELGTFPFNPPSTIDVNSYEFFEPIIGVDDFVRGFELNGKALFYDFYSNLFTTDGTAEGTSFLLEDFQNKFVTNTLGTFEGALYFSHETDETGDELWVTDGSKENLFMIEDLYPGTNHSNPKSMHRFRDNLYFIASHPKYGTEVFVLDNFFSPNLTGIVFDDLNNDGIQDVGELGISGIQVEISPGGQRTTTDEFGGYGFEVDAGETYELTIIDEDCWRYCLNEAIELDAAMNQNYLVDYEVNIPACSQGMDVDEIFVDFTSSVARCNTLGKHWINILNNSCQDHSGKIEVRFDPLDTILIVDVPFDSLAGVYTFEFDDLKQNSIYPIDIVVKRGNETFASDTMHYELTSYILEDGGYVELETSNVSQILRCAYDPNDKQVSPSRAEETNSNYTQFDERLIYKVRFQNTGNDTAYNVLITDTLSPLLDPSSFEFISASHPTNVQARNDGVLNFYFSNIYLVDSLTNEPESHGYVSFSIKAYDDIAELDAIVNKAQIYFDLNQAIITNEVKNTFVEFLDMDGDGYLFYEDCDDTNPEVYPGAVEIPNNGIDEDCDEEDATTFLDNDGDGITSETDCDDNDPNVYPGAAEICNGMDDNCDGLIDEGIPLVVYYADSDGDNYGDADVFIEDCMSPTGYVINSEDCDDTNPNINPTAVEIPDNGIDEDCDGEDLISATHDLANRQLKIYPNPTTDIVRIKVDGQLELQVTLFDMAGRMIKEYFNPNQISLAGLPAGSFLLEVRELNSGQSIVEKLVKI